ncbi:hypothetical protein LC065_06070 [Halobacillus litoralis]|uniref:hypothetical protein n=1 Tax=Halobacillus litoralis TaxID=45668 RepID=UPI001CFDC077|nr:hypothetical protein [Halobacillus litoralis]WLR48746.1 hypothetical protein LC065_06070 [Halobacillus litoralis]
MNRKLSGDEPQMKVYKNFVLTFLLYSLFILAALAIHYLLSPTPFQYVRSIICFGLAPALILYANFKQLWFRSSLRWVIKVSRRPVLSSTIFVVGALASFDLAFHLPLSGIVHLLLLGFGSIIYWAPLLLQCSFIQLQNYMRRFLYLLLTSLLFVLYHEASFYFSGREQSEGFLYTGVMIMLIQLFSLIMEWADAEKDTDPLNVKGYFKSVSKN